jgi:hypothetical protein
MAAPRQIRAHSKKDPEEEKALVKPHFSTPSARLRNFSHMQKRVWSLG